MGPRGGPICMPWIFTKAKIPLRSPLSHEDILSSLHLRVISVDFLTFSDFSKCFFSMYWKVSSPKNIKTIEIVFKCSHVPAVLATNSEQCICDLSKACNLDSFHQLFEDVSACSCNFLQLSESGCCCIAFLGLTIFGSL